METKEIIFSLNRCGSLMGCNSECKYHKRYEPSYCRSKLLKDAADRLKELEKKNYVLHEDNSRLLDKIADYECRIAKLEKQLSEQQDKWISVKDQLPEEKQEIFMCFMERKFFLVLRGFYANSEWYVYTGVNLYTQCDDIPSFWVPSSIIEPPKPKEPTFKDVFLEKFPKVQIDERGIPRITCCTVFPYLHDGRNICQSFENCSDCWNQPYFEEEGEDNE